MKKFRGIVSHQGWGSYSDSGRPYRKWEFKEAVPALDARSGDELHDRGPDSDPRFMVRREDEDDCFPDYDAMSEFFDDCLPPWDPPNEAEIRVARQLGGGRRGARRIARQLQELASSLRSGGSSSTSSTEENKGLQFGCLTLDREGRYSNTGGRFRIWTFLEDRPEIPATELNHYSDLGGKPHAMEGDELWQEPDRLTPFKLKRDEYQIGSPEHWQLSDAFGGDIPGWPLQSDRGQDQGGRSGGGGPEPGLLRYVSEKTVDGREVRADHTSDSRMSAPRRGVYRLSRDLADMKMECGDALVLAYDKEDRPARMKGDARGLDPDEIEELREALREVWRSMDDWPPRVPPLALAIRESFDCLSGPESAMIGARDKYRWRERGLYCFLDNANRWGRRLSEFHYRLFHLRPAFQGPGDVTRPIRAASDESAAFELLAQVTESNA